MEWITRTEEKELKEKVRFDNLPEWLQELTIYQMKD